MQVNTLVSSIDRQIKEAEDFKENVLEKSLENIKGLVRKQSQYIDSLRKEKCEILRQQALDTFVAEYLGNNHSIEYHGVADGISTKYNHDCIYDDNTMILFKNYITQEIIAVCPKCGNEYII